ncbi:hypothetical protein AB0K11_07525 [Mycobacterium sp. NPDC050551]|uniref:hypothetical protein n=1 Tax=Mycobacterium sp. NPDC050551 TaxID=3155407 RepID=UPI00342515B0
MKVVSVSWIADAVVPNSSAIAGKAGRYMSVASGATAVSSASTPSQSRGSGRVAACVAGASTPTAVWELITLDSLCIDL